jgi:hypothetical protein
MMAVTLIRIKLAVQKCKRKLTLQRELNSVNHVCLGEIDVAPFFGFSPSREGAGSMRRFPLDPAKSRLSKNSSSLHVNS